MKQKTLTLPENFGQSFEKFLKRHIKDKNLAVKADVKLNLHGCNIRLLHTFDPGTITIHFVVTETDVNAKVIVNLGNTIKGLPDGTYVTGHTEYIGDGLQEVITRLLGKTEKLVDKHDAARRKRELKEAKEAAKAAKKAAKEQKCCKTCCGHCKDGECSCGHCKKSK